MNPSGVLNVLLNLFFLLVLKMTAQPVQVERKYFQFDLTVFKRILQIGLPTGLQSAVFAIANIAVQSAINSLGTITIVASSAAFNLEIFAYYIFNSFSQTCTTFVGQNYGAGNIEPLKPSCSLILSDWDWLRFASSLP